MSAAALKALLPLTKVAELYGVPITKGHGRQPCPFCGSRTAFKVTRDLYYKCYKCEKSGDIFKLLQDINRAKDFKEAYRLLGSENVNFSSSTFYYANINGLEKAFRQYQKEAENNSLLLEQYYKQRGWTYKPGAVGLAQKNTLQRAGWPTEELEELGLYNPEYETEHYNNHIVFPVRNTSGQIVHFSGRSLDPDSQLRWKHTKGKIPINNFLYNAESIKKDQPLFMCEGVSDCQSITEMNCPTVAIFGVNIPLIQHSQLLKECSCVIAVFDRDKYPIGHKQEGEYKSWSNIMPYLIELSTEIKKPIYYLMTPDLSGIKDVNDFLKEIEYDRNEFNNWVNTKQPLHKLALELYLENPKDHELLWRLQASKPLPAFNTFMEEHIANNYGSVSEYLTRIYA
jgi:hypothetical protein